MTVLSPSKVASTFMSAAQAQSNTVGTGRSSSQCGQKWHYRAKLMSKPAYVHHVSVCHISSMSVRALCIILQAALHVDD